MKTIKTMLLGLTLLTGGSLVAQETPFWSWKNAKEAGHAVLVGCSIGFIAGSLANASISDLQPPEIGRLSLMAISGAACGAASFFSADTLFKNSPAKNLVFPAAVFGYFAGHISNMLAHGARWRS